MTAPRSAQDPQPEARVTTPQPRQAPEERVTLPRSAADPEDRATAPRPAQSPGDRVTTPRTAQDVEDRVTAPRSSQNPDFEDTAAIAKGTRRAVQPVEGYADHQEEPLLLESPIRGRQQGIEAQKQADLGRWNEALTDATIEEGGGALPPPPPGGSHGPRETIPLGKDELQLMPAPASSRPSKRADSSDGMKPGEMVIGAPPATHPERTLHGIMPRDEVTAEHDAVLPAEARRPEDRITEETVAVLPPDAFAETINGPGPGQRDSEGDES